MKIVVAGASGNVGYRTAERLIDGGVFPVLIARNTKAVKPLLDRGAQLVAGGLDSFEVLDAATANADALLWMTPPALSEPSLQGWYRRTARLAAQAIEKNGVKRVVHISAVGALPNTGLGTVSYVAEVELALAAACRNLVNLRPGYFMQNLAQQLKEISKLPENQPAELQMTFEPDHDVPWINAFDIGDVAAGYLMEPTWAGQWSRNLMGPQNLTMIEVAVIVSIAANRSVRYQQIPLEAMSEIFAAQGANKKVQSEMTDLLTALGDKDGVYATTRTFEAATPSTLKQFVENCLGAR